MTNPRKIRNSALTLNAMMEAFEHCYMSVIDIGECEPELREKGCYAFYGLRDMLGILVNEMEQLAGHMEMCDVILAIAHKDEVALQLLKEQEKAARRKERQKGNQASDKKEG